jgi:hypothetical protein
MAPLDSYHLTLIIVALITGVISPVILQLTKYLLTRRPHKKEGLRSDSQDEEVIIKKLDTLLTKYNADRAWIIEFHNGEHTFTGKSIQKFSETYEEVRKGISAEAIFTQSIPTSIFSKFFNTLNDVGYFYIDDILHLKSNNFIAQSILSFLEARGIKSFIGIAIKSIKGNFVGVLCIDGVNNLLNLTPLQIQDLIYTAANLAGYLENVDSEDYPINSSYGSKKEKT